MAKFEVMGLIEYENSNADKRVRTVVATAKAQQLLNHIRVAIGSDLYQVFSSVDDTEIESFATSLKQLGNWLDKSRLA